MGDVVSFPSSLLDDHELIKNLARYSEGLLSQEAVKKKHRLAASVWERLGENDELVEKIEAVKLQRIRDGSSKRERAQQLVVKAPGVLGDIMLDTSASPKHRIDSAKVLDQFAANGPQAAPARDRFITIDLTADGSNSGADVLHFDKPLAIGPDDSAPQNAVAAITKKDDDSGQGYL